MAKVKYKKVPANKTTKKIKDTKKQNRISLITVGALCLAAIFMAVGFAAYSQTLNITGTTTVGSSVWDIHFDPDTYQDRSGYGGTISAHNFNGTSGTFTCSLTKPGDRCGFFIYAVNAGTFDAKIIPASGITISGLSDAQKKYIYYNVDVEDYDENNGGQCRWGKDPYSLDYYDTPNCYYYDNGTAYTPLLKAGSANNTDKNEVYVDVYYTNPANAADLPSTAQNITLTANLNYVQM